MVVLLTAGCQMMKTSKPPITATVIKSVPAPAVREAPRQAAAQAGAMNQCQRELDSLQQVNPTAGKRLKMQFDQLLRNAALYNGVRTGINGETRSTVDALFTFKSGEVCAQVQRELLEGLIRRVGGSAS
jgi:hypothetical protein